MRERSCVLPENVLHFVTGDKMLLKYVSVFLLSMVPVLELRGAIPVAVSMDLNYWASLVICVIGNMLPVPFILLFIRFTAAAYSTPRILLGVLMISA